MRKARRAASTLPPETAARQNRQQRPQKKIGPQASKFRRSRSAFFAREGRGMTPETAARIAAMIEGENLPEVTQVVNGVPVALSAPNRADDLQMR
jgi:hypothetical protein